MKKLLFAILSVLPFVGKTQTITTIDLPTAGIAWTTGNDSTYTQAIPTTGASQTWDYSTLQNLLTDTLGFIEAATTPYASSFPGSNLSGYDQSTGTYSYFTTNSTGIYVDGIANLTTLFAYDQSALYFPVPFSYGDVRNSFSRIQIDTVYMGTNARVVLRTNSTFTADATGNLTLPSGQFANVLRIKEVATTYDSISADLFGTGIYTPVSNSASQVTRYSFMKPGNAVVLIMGLEADSLGQFATSSQYFTGAYVNSVSTVQGPSKIKTYPNPANESINFDLTTVSDISIIEIFDLKGNLIKTIQPDASGITSVSAIELSNGIYHYSISGKGKKLSGTFQVQH